jgi:hypothetical protein
MTDKKIVKNVGKKSWFRVKYYPGIFLAELWKNT